MITKPKPTIDFTAIAPNGAVVLRLAVSGIDHRYSTAGRDLLRQPVARVALVVHGCTPAAAAIESLDEMEDVRDLAALLSAE